MTFWRLGGLSCAIFGRMARPDAQYPILIWALTIRGEIMAVHCTTRAEALEIGRANVASGAWRTWDAFRVFLDATEIEAHKIASSDEQSPTTPAARPRILAGWTPPEPPKAPAPPAEVVLSPSRSHGEGIPKGVSRHGDSGEAEGDAAAADHSGVRETGGFWILDSRRGTRMGGLMD